MQRAAALGRERKHALHIRLRLLQKRLPARVALHAGVFMVVQPGAAQLGIFHGKAQRLDQVQVAPCIGGQANDIAGVGRNLRLIQHDMKHGCQVYALMRSRRQTRPCK